MKLVLSKQPDFAAAKSALTEFVEGQGQLLDMSPKLHPELAGVGVECGWAVAKQEFRAKNDFQIRTLSTRVVHSLSMLSIPVLRNCARRARDYERAYRALDGGSGTELQHKAIEAQKKLAKHHRETHWTSVRRGQRHSEPRRKPAGPPAPPASRAASQHSLCTKRPTRGGWC